MVWSNRLGHPAGRWPKIFFEATIFPVRIPEAVRTLYYPLRHLLHPPFTCKRALHPPFSLPSITGLLHACAGASSLPTFLTDGYWADVGTLTFPWGDLFSLVLYLRSQQVPPYTSPLPFWIGPARRCAGFRYSTSGTVTALCLPADLFPFLVPYGWATCE